jgi:hypothetical protein
MKKILFTFLVFAFCLAARGQKITELTEATVVDGTSLMITRAGSTGNLLKKITIANIFKDRTFTGTTTLAATTSIGNVSATEISYLDNAASNIQAQLYDTTTLNIVITAQVASYTLALSDNWKLVTMSSVSAMNLTVPPNSSVAFPIGANITIVGINTGQVTIVAGSGVTINSADGKLKLRVRYSSATLIKTATDTWILIGDIAA